MSTNQSEKYILKEVGRGPKQFYGEDNPSAKFSDAQVAHVRELHKSGMNVIQIHELNPNISKSSIVQFIRNQRRLPAPLRVIRRVKVK